MCETCDRIVSFGLTLEELKLKNDYEEVFRTMGYVLVFCHYYASMPYPQYFDEQRIVYKYRNDYDMLMQRREQLTSGQWDAMISEFLGMGLADWQAIEFEILKAFVMLAVFYTKYLTAFRVIDAVVDRALQGEYNVVH